MNFPEMVWTYGRDGWFSRPLTDGDRERRALMRQWANGELTYHQVASIVRDKGLSAQECDWR